MAPPRASLPSSKEDDIRPGLEDEQLFQRRRHRALCPQPVLCSCVLPLAPPQTTLFLHSITRSPFQISFSKVFTESPLLAGKKHLSRPLVIRLYSSTHRPRARTRPLPSSPSHACWGRPHLPMPEPWLKPPFTPGQQAYSLCVLVAELPQCPPNSPGPLPPRPLSPPLTTIPITICLIYDLLVTLPQGQGAFLICPE